MKYIIFILSLGACGGRIYHEHKERLKRLEEGIPKMTIQVGPKGKPCARYLIDKIWVDVYDCGPNNEYSNYRSN